MQYIKVHEAKNMTITAEIRFCTREDSCSHLLTFPSTATPRTTSRTGLRLRYGLDLGAGERGEFLL